jgi:peptidoglycan/xylan/chitin deacetylase (PgdA/CDA1 family)
MRSSWIPRFIAPHAGTTLPIMNLRLFLLWVVLALAEARAAYLVQIDTDGADDGRIGWNPDFAFGGDTTTAVESTNTRAPGMSAGDSIFGGNGNSGPDTYVFTYSPGVRADNLFLDRGTPLGGGDVASGAVGGVPGTYAVYACWPTSTNVSGGLTTYQVTTAGSTASRSVDQNATGDVWVKIGEVEHASGAITVTQTAGANTFVSMRAAGVLFERLVDGGDPGYTGPPGPVIFGQGAGRSFGIAFRRNRTEALSHHFAAVESEDLVDWRTTDLKLFSVTASDPEHDLVTFRSMLPMSAGPRRFLAVRKTARMPVGANYVAITFDDGPHPTRTPQLLELLAERNIRATFYVTGINAGYHPQVIRRMLNEGHEIGNHSQTHARLTDLTLDEVRAEVEGCRDAVVAAATLPTTSIRPPYGAVNPALRDLFQNEYGYPTVLWEVDPRDWDSAVSNEQVIATILNDSDSGEIILCHDIHQRTIDVMPAVLDGLLARGFTFVTVREILALRGG